jgi:predicted ABC-type exoprotein transport system permease subunit
VIIPVFVSADFMTMVIGTIAGKLFIVLFWKVHWIVLSGIIIWNYISSFPFIDIIVSYAASTWYLVYIIDDHQRVLTLKQCIAL